MLLMTLILLVTTGTTNVILRQAKYSRSIKDSAIAYNAADMAVGCTAFIENTFVNTSSTYGIFPIDRALYPLGNELATEIADTIIEINSDRLTRNVPVIATVDDIKCGGVRVFNPADSQIAYTAFTYTKSDLSTEDGKKSTFNLKMPLSNGEFRCASVILNKSPSFNQIIASGYSTCDASAKSRIERTIVSSAEKT
jgi:hypothetical protein